MLTDDGLYHPQVWRHASVNTYRIIHQANFGITTTGLHEFRLSPVERSRIKDGDMIGLFTRLSNEAAVIGYDYVPCGSPTLLHQLASEVTSPLTFNVFHNPSNLCRHYSFNAIYAGNAQIVEK